MIKEELFLKQYFKAIILLTITVLSFLFLLIVALALDFLQNTIIPLLLFILFSSSLLILAFFVLINISKIKTNKTKIINFYKNFDASVEYIDVINARIDNGKEDIPGEFKITLNEQGFVLENKQFQSFFNWQDFLIKISRATVYIPKAGRTVFTYLIIYNDVYLIELECNIKNYYLFMNYSKKKISYMEKDIKFLERLLGRDFDQNMDK